MPYRGFTCPRPGTQLAKMISVNYMLNNRKRCHKTHSLDEESMQQRLRGMSHSMIVIPNDNPSTFTDLRQKDRNYTVNLLILVFFQRFVVYSRDDHRFSLGKHTKECISPGTALRREKQHIISALIVNNANSNYHITQKSAQPTKEN